jgi:hypothetical protein
VLVFFEFSETPDNHVIRYLRAAGKSYAGRVHVVPLMLGGTGEDVRRLRLDAAVYHGDRALAAFVATTPRAIVLDRDGLVRQVLPGWGADYPDLLHRELVKIIEGKSK